jgi:hypothetical protein
LLVEGIRRLARVVDRMQKVDASTAQIVSWTGSVG